MHCRLSLNFQFLLSLVLKLGLEILFSPGLLMLKNPEYIVCSLSLLKIESNLGVRLACFTHFCFLKVRKQVDLMDLVQIPGSHGEDLLCSRN